MIDLHQVPLFSDIPGDDLIHIVPYFQERRFKKYHIFMFENDPIEFIYVLRSGKVKVCRIHEDREIIVGFQFPGDVIGEAEALAEDNHCIATIEALENVTAWQIAKKDFLELVNRYPSILHSAYNILFGHARILNRTIRYLTFCDVRSKIANLIMDLYCNFGNKKGHIYMIDLKINHAMLANMVGVARESISKTLNEFQKERIIEIREKYIYLLDVDTLEQICHHTEDIHELRIW